MGATDLVALNSLQCNTEQQMPESGPSSLSAAGTSAPILAVAHLCKQYGTTVAVDGVTCNRCHGAAGTAATDHVLDDKLAP